ncbi:MAG: glycogen/starch synthase, partial [Eubacteriales bacterium]|nr:glycogen/starch synthase [Eubacteriales bacterium]
MPEKKKTEAKAEERITEEIKKTPKQPPYKVLFLASECVPFVKTGGLADVIGALPKELKRQGVDVRVMIPLYSAIGPKYREQMTRICEFYVKLGWRSQYCGILTMEYQGVPVYFIDNEYYFGRGYIYGQCNSDEGERFAFFSKAALEAMPHIGFFPDVLHAHDWQAAMSIALLRMQYGRSQDYRRIRTVYTIHNLKYQGVFNWPFMDELLSIGPEHFTGESLEYYGDINFTKGALVYSDAITTVSPTYAREIQGPEYGETLDGVLRWRSRDIYGIMNGIDESLFDPATDKAIYANYSIDDMSGKKKCKESLRTEFWLDKDDSPIVGIVTRFTDQKGLDLIEYAMAALMEKGVQLAVLG